MPGLIFGRTPTGVYIPIRTDDNGYLFVGGKTGADVHLPFLLSADGSLSVAGQDILGDEIALRVTDEGYLCIAGSTESGTDIPLLVDDSGRAEVGVHGWIGGVWRKNPLAFGYSSDYTFQDLYTVVNEGNVARESDAVPAGKIWIVQAASAVNGTRAITRIRIYLSVNGVWLALAVDRTPAQGSDLVWSGQVVLSEGDRVKYYYEGCSADDEVVSRCHAVVVNINQ